MYTSAFSIAIVIMQIECLLPKAKVTFTKFGERYCVNANYHPRAYYGSKYDGESLQVDCENSPAGCT